MEARTAGSHALSRAIWVVAALSVVVAAATPAVATTAQIKVSPHVGPPTSTTTVRGNGFGSSERIDVAFDGLVLEVATTNTNGRFTAPLGIPEEALPGGHVVSATGETSGSTAQTNFL